MEYFQRSNLQPPKWIRESHSTRQLHLIKVTFQDHTGKEVTLYGDRYFRSVKEAEHNTSILVLCHLMPGVKSPKDIIERMSQLQKISKLQKRRRQENKPLRMSAYSWKPKPYARVQNGQQSYNGYAAQIKAQTQQLKHYDYSSYAYDAATQQYYDPTTAAAYQAAYQNYNWGTHAMAMSVPGMTSMVMSSQQPTTYPYDYSSYAQPQKQETSNSAAQTAQTHQYGMTMSVPGMSGMIMAQPNAASAYQYDYSAYAAAAAAAQPVVKQESQSQNAQIGLNLGTQQHPNLTLSHYNRHRHQNSYTNSNNNLTRDRFVQIKN